MQSGHKGIKTLFIPKLIQDKNKIGKVYTQKRKFAQLEFDFMDKSNGKLCYVQK